MKRREFIALLSGAATLPFEARAQQSEIPVIGIVETRTPSETLNIIEGLREDLRDAGYVDGKNVAIQSYYAGNEQERLEELVAGLVRQRVAVIFVPGAGAAAIAARNATTTIPIVFMPGVIL